MQPPLVAVLVETDDTWGRKVVTAIANTARAADWNLVICPRDSQRRLRIPARWGGQGVIASLRDRSTVRHVKSCGLPAVDVSTMMPKETWLGRVSTADDVRAAMAFEHLRNKGFSRFATYAPRIHRYPDARAQYFTDVAKSAGCECFQFAAPSNSANSVWLARYKDVLTWLESLPTPIAVYTPDPYPARHLSEICARASIKVPQDIALISGDDDDVLCKVATPEITSIEPNCFQIGKHACEMLHELMSDKNIEPFQVLIPPIGVIERQSTDVLAIEDTELAEILHLIQERASAGLNVGDILRRFPMSRRSLEIRFQESLKRTPSEEIRRVRLQEAHRLLLNTDLPVSAVARAVGLSSGPALSHAFRKYLGCTPSDVRKMRRRL